MPPTTNDVSITNQWGHPLQGVPEDL